MGVGKRLDVEDKTLGQRFFMGYQGRVSTARSEFGAQIQQINKSTITAARTTPHYVAFLLLRL